MTTCNYEEVPTVDPSHELEHKTSCNGQINIKQRPEYSNKLYKQLLLGRFTIDV